MNPDKPLSDISLASQRRNGADSERRPRGRRLEKVRGKTILKKNETLVQRPEVNRSRGILAKKVGVNSGTTYRRTRKVRDEAKGEGDEKHLKVNRELFRWC